MSRAAFEEYAAVHDDRAREPGARYVGWLASAIPGDTDADRLMVGAARCVRGESIGYISASSDADSDGS